MSKLYVLSLVTAIFSAVSFSALADERVKDITRSNGSTAYTCFSSNCFKENYHQDRYNDKLKYIKNHACKNTSALENKHCKEELETLNAIKQCHNDLCASARCTKTQMSDNSCISSTFR